MHVSQSASCEMQSTGPLWLQRKKVDDFTVMAAVSVAASLQDILSTMDHGTVKIGALILGAIGVPDILARASIDVSMQAHMFRPSYQPLCQVLKRCRRKHPALSLQ
jgi:hypothetical protein